MLVGYWGGRAYTGATYEIEVTKDTETYQVQAFSAACGGPRKAQTILYTGPDEEKALDALLKQATKKRQGRERSYTECITGASCQLAWTPKLQAGTLPTHDQLWVAGRELNTLPPEHRNRIGSTAAVGSSVEPDLNELPFQISNLGSTIAPAPISSPLASAPVALCHQADEAAAQKMIASDDWIAMRKVEGRRAQIRVQDDQVVMTNRSGGQVECPPHIAAAAAGLPNGTVLDGELVALTDSGQESLYAGGAACNVVFVAFDVLHLDGVSWLLKPQSERFHALSGAVAALGTQTCIRLVETAVTQQEKADLLQRASAEGWEGLLFRNANAPYPSGRSHDWLKYKLRFETMDVVVTGYQPGKGRLKDTVGAVKVALYDAELNLIDIGEVGSGWTDEQRAELQRRRDSGEVEYVIAVRAEGFTAGKKLVRPVGVDIRPNGDKLAQECVVSETIA